MHVKKSTFIKLTDSTSMRALYVICEYLELRFGINAGFISDQDIVILLKSICFLSFFINDYFTVENAGLAIFKNTFIQFMTFTIFFFVMHKSMVINMLLITDYSDSVQI